MNKTEYYDYFIESSVELMCADAVNEKDLERKTFESKEELIKHL